MGRPRPCLTIAIFTAVCVHYGWSQTMDQLISAAMPSSSDMDLNMDEDTVRVELDMLFTRDDWDEIQQLNGDNSVDYYYSDGDLLDILTNSRRHKRKATRDLRYRWTNKEVPYTLANHFSSADLQQIQAAINDWEKYTCINFRQATSRDSNRIQIASGSGCSSYVGMIGGQQSVSLAQGCRQKGVIVHELGHAIGFHHEQTRPDRGSHVRILTQNIIRGTEYNFQRYSTQVQNDYEVPYDYTSVMHYGQYAFSANGRPTIQTLDSSKQHLIGNRYGHSFRDIKLANAMYRCSDHCGSKTCPGEGFLGKDCKCYCPGSPISLCNDDGGGGGGDECTDSHANCASWAASGECDNNPTFMLSNCKESCENCDGDGGGGGNSGECVDSNEYCNHWAGQRFCTHPSYQTYMAENCKESCNLCNGGGGGGGSCTDESEHCQYWASTGECSNNSAYMHLSCRQSCNLC